MRKFLKRHRAHEPKSISNNCFDRCFSSFFQKQKKLILFYTFFILYFSLFDHKPNKKQHFAYFSDPHTKIILFISFKKNCKKTQPTNEIPRNFLRWKIIQNVVFHVRKQASERIVNFNNFFSFTLSLNDQMALSENPLKV